MNLDLNLARRQDELSAEDLRYFLACEEFAALAPKMPGPDDELSEAEWAVLNYDPLDDPEKWAAFCEWHDKEGVLRTRRPSTSHAACGFPAPIYFAPTPMEPVRLGQRNVEADADDVMQADAAQDRTKPLLEGAVDFLKLLRPSGQWQLTAITPEGAIVTRTIRSVEAAHEFIREYNGTRNLYFSVNPVRVENRKASKPDVTAIEFVLADLDPRDDETPDAAKARYLAALKSFQPAPTFVIDSGNGVQVLWRFDQPIALPKPVKGVDPQGKPIWVLAPEAKSVIDDAEARIKAVMETLGSVAGTQNIDRILRLPWTTNLPNEVKRKKGRKPCQSSLLSAEEAVCKLEDFPAPSSGTKTDSSGESSTGGASSGSSGADTSSSGNTNTGNTSTGNTSIDWAAVEQHKGWLKSANNLPDDFSEKGKKIIAHSGNLNDLNFDLDQAGLLTKDKATGQSKPYKSWSEVTLALTGTFKYDGRYSNEQIAAALLADLECNQHIANQADKRRAIERVIARTQAQPPKWRNGSSPDWRERKDSGAPAPSMHNARLAITGLGVECSYDTFHNKLLFGFKDDSVRHAVEHIVGEVTDNGIIALRQLMSDTFGFDLTDKHTRDAVISLALEHCFDPVVDMLAEAEAGWDGVKRLDRMAAEYFNCEDTTLNAAFIRKMMIGAVARARIPGIKFDTIPVLESAEGFNKSTAIRVLAGDENFSDESIIGKNSREVQEQLAEVWIHENADLAGMKKTEVETVKAYASRQTDRARPAYGHFLKKQQRHSIEVGTTNSDRYLQSQTGNRRFWPLRVLKSIDIAKLKRDRLQLWGEAAHYQSQGESLVLDEKLWGEAAVEQEARRVTDPWEDNLRNMPQLTPYGYWKDGVHHEGTRTIIYYDEYEEKVIGCMCWSMSWASSQGTKPPNTPCGWRPP
jgi:hypothetical protein